MSKPKPIDDADRAREGQGRVAVVAGASAGIGLAMARLLAAKGFDVVLIARRKERLDALKQEVEARWGVIVHPLVADMSIPGEPQRIADELGRMGLHADFLVNSAGYTLMGRFTDKTWAQNEHYLRTLGISTIELTHHLLPGMIERRWGRIVNVCSIAASMQHSPTSVLYAGTKSLIQKFTEGIAAENVIYGIQATASLPGMTATEIFEVGGYQKYVDQHKGAQLTMMQAEDVAREAYAAVMRGQRTIVHGWSNKIVVFLLLHTPIALRRALAQAMTGAIKFD